RGAVCISGFDLLAVDARCENGNSLRALLHVASQLLPSVKSGDSGGRRALQSNEDLVVPAIGMEFRHGVEPVKKQFASAGLIGFRGQGVYADLDLFRERARFVVR